MIESGAVNVRIRHEDSATGGGPAFTVWPLSDGEGLIAQLEAQGGVAYRGAQYTNMSYQLVLDESGAFMEVVLHDDDG